MSTPGACSGAPSSIGSPVGCTPSPSPTLAPSPSPTSQATTGSGTAARPGVGAPGTGSHGSAAADPLHQLLGLAWPAVSIALALLCVVLLILLVAEHRRTARAAAARPTSDPQRLEPTRTPAPPPDLVEDLIALADLAASPAVLAQVTRLLRRLGTEPIEAQEGAPFDPDRFAVTDTRPTDDDELDNRVARQVRPGWRTGPTLLRPADVTVWVRA